MMTFSDFLPNVLHDLRGIDPVQAGVLWFSELPSAASSAPSWVR